MSRFRPGGARPCARNWKMREIDLKDLTLAELCDLLHQVTEEIARRWEESRVPKEDK